MVKIVNSQNLKSNFRMKDHEYLKNLKSPGNFMARIDLSNAFFSIPLHKDSTNCFTHLLPKVTNMIFASSPSDSPHPLQYLPKL